jgi:hypothetical protein
MVGTVNMKLSLDALHVQFPGSAKESVAQRVPIRQGHA